MSATSASWRLLHDADLRGRNTFGVAARAPLLAELHEAAALPMLLASEHFVGTTPLIIGSGSNLLFAADPQQPLIAITARDVRIASDDDRHAIVHADAGVEWHAFVMQMLDAGWHGLQNLALIPGTVGAAPIQNIGAYGVEVCERIHAVHAWDRAASRHLRLDREACEFAYRDSLFKREPDRWVVTSVEFALDRSVQVQTAYAGIADALAACGIAEPTPRQVADAVIAVRRSKLPDPATLGNAGSFFKNPIVDAAFGDVLHAQHPQLPQYPVGNDGQRKLSAAWLIDACGWKGHREGDAGVSDAHALVLVNHGDASGAELFALAKRIAASVQQRFGVAIEPEPRIIGARW